MRCLLFTALLGVGIIFLAHPEPLHGGTAAKTARPTSPIYLPPETYPPDVSPVPRRRDFRASWMGGGSVMPWLPDWADPDIPWPLPPLPPRPIPRPPEPQPWFWFQSRLWIGGPEEQVWWVHDPVTLDWFIYDELMDLMYVLVPDADGSYVLVDE